MGAEAAAPSASRPIPTSSPTHTTSLSAPAGKDTIEFDNPSATGHDVCVQDSGGKELGCTDVIEQSNASLSLDLQPGTYTFFCSVPGHEAAGMKGTLTVK